jgi:hypothetical protein
LTNVRDDEQSEDDAEQTAKEDGPGYHLIGEEVDQHKEERTQEGRDPSRKLNFSDDSEDIIFVGCIAHGQHLLPQGGVSRQAEQSDPT